MRISTITISFVSVVFRVIDSVAVAGIAMAAFFHRAYARELRASEALGNWLELCQSWYATLNDQVGKSNPGKHPGLLRPLGIQQLAVCPVQNRLGCTPSSLRS
ncbi:MAG: hypothetical protein KDB22_04710 [Planctomycetales bacterium]|nr:hypothetical protein [Planctomycetales bacterium]